MDKRTHRIVGLMGAGFLAITAGACQQPASEGPTTTLVPIQSRTAPPATGSEAKAGPPKPGAGSTVKSGAKTPSGPQTKAGTKGPAIAKGGDPFAPKAAGAKPGTPKSGAAPTAAAAPRLLVFSGRRKDPFYIDWRLPVPPPYVFDEVEPIRLASDFVETPSPVPYEVREQPEMRVSGILTGDGVFAILETGGNKVDVVKPGSSVDVAVGGQTNRTYKVVSITKDKVRLRSQVGNVIYTQEVPLSDVAVGTTARQGFGGPGLGGPGVGAPGGSGGPGIGGPRGGFPGGSGGPGGRPGRGGSGGAVGA